MDDDPVPEVSARERLRSGHAETPPPDNRRTRRAATMMFIPLFVGVPLLGYLLIDGDSTTARIVGVLLIVYLAVMGYLMVKSIVRR
ncbi:hypothetical protein [Tsukamurella pseudospumae]|uniref:Uncharacterized protein n=1 Tax=Tsukamurella pseudospumae TaxID=239498 RepID=A0A138AVC7_9ACTN|nr:hypothetical protein [Tsukamurella pseudospumae]KXP14349.1 hypothetical protein AXK60_00030 [Tsukamurella pseudospumae]